MPRILDSIHSPKDLKKLSTPELEVLAAEIRRELVTTTSVTGGHIGPNLGVVELTIALHKSLDCPRDVIAFDVGHQAYVHKLLTGRAGCFDGLRCSGGISGFPCRGESEYDLYGSGHASDSISIAYGYAKAREAAGTNEHIVAVIGDGSLTGGMAWEGLNNVGHSRTKMIIVLNDNEMSISKNVGALSLYLGRVRLDERYWGPRNKMKDKLRDKGDFGKRIVDTGITVRDSFKKLVVSGPGMLFEEMGISYVGPIDGHDIDRVTRAIELAKGADGPVIIHAITKKGMGYEPAMERPDAFHGIAPFEVSTGEVKANNANPAYTKVFSEAIIKEAEKNPKIHAITAAMAPGTGLDAFEKHFPERFHDVGIAEGHAVGMAAGMAFGGLTPVVAIYSTFLQRAYDQIMGDVALQGAHVVFAVDRGGFVGDDGPTHHGLYDLSYLRSIPTMKILAPSNEAELVSALHTAIKMDDGPIALRYPRGAGVGEPIPEEPELFELGVSKELRAGNRVAILAVGRMVKEALLAAEKLEEQGISTRVVDMRWVKPLDVDAIARAAQECELIVTIEENTVRGGFGAAVAESLIEQEFDCAKQLLLAVPDEFGTHGDMQELVIAAGIDANSAVAKILKRLGKADSKAKDTSAKTLESED